MAKVEVNKDVLYKCMNYWSNVGGDVQAMMEVDKYEKKIQFK